MLNENHETAPTSPLEGIAKSLMEAGTKIYGLDLANLSPRDIATLRVLGRLAKEVASDATNRAEAAIEQTGRSPIPMSFKRIDPNIVTERILYTQELPLWIPEEPTIAKTIVAVDELTIASGHTSYTFPTETGKDKLVLGLFNAAFACRFNLPGTSVLESTAWIRQLGQPKPALIFVRDLINEMTDTAHAYGPMAEFRRVGMGHPLCLSRNLLIASLPDPDSDSN